MSSGDAAETKRDNAKARESLMTNDAAVLRVMVAELSKCLRLCMQQLADASVETMIDTSSRLKITRKTAALTRVMPTFPLRCEENVVRWKWTILCFPEHWVVWVGV